MRCFKRIYLLVLLLFVLSTSGYSQGSHFTRSDHWKTQRKELIFGAGASNFLGDLGGLNRIGTHYIPVDIDWNTTRPSGHVGFRYRFASMWATKTLIQYAVLKGDDALTNEPARRNRNLSFRTHLFELSQHIEFLFFSNERYGARHKIYGLKGMRNKNTVAYLFTGVTGFGFIPQGPGDGGWTNLRPLHTEGQGLTGGGTEYKKIGLGIPIGIGYKIGLDPLWRMSFELSYTQTFTDYLDDVSGLYFDNDLIQASYGSTSAYFADPSTGAFPTWTHTGELRGDSKHKDGYLFLNISFIRNITDMRSGRIKWKYKRRYKL
ncbi:MAG: hypothetical protein GQ574_20730 [Crocinitomix sp.]|nr:hypothetical protein [Crocinitomix sp.]